MEYTPNWGHLPHQACEWDYPHICAIFGVPRWAAAVASPYPLVGPANGPVSEVVTVLKRSPPSAGLIWRMFQQLWQACSELAD